MSSWSKACVSAAVLTIASIASAQERVTLADGTVMQGELIEKVPGNHITIKLATGEIRTIQWSALAPAPPPAMPVMQQPMMPPPATPSGPPIHVVVDADHPGVSLVRVTGYGMVQAYNGYGTAYGAFEQSHPVCIAPCQADVDSNGMYRIAGDGVTQTGTFGMPPAQANSTVHLHVHAGSFGARIGGLWLIVGGVSLALPGGLLAGLGAADSSSFGSNSGVIVTGLVLTGIGVAALVAGIVLVAGSGTSVVTDDGVNVASKSPSKPHLTTSGLVF